MARPVKHVVRLFGIAASLAATAALPVSAQLIYSNGVPDNIDGYAVGQGLTEANDFPLLSTTQLGTFEWYVLRHGTNGPPTISTNFNWTVYADVGGSPDATALGSGSVAATGTKTAFFCCALVSYDWDAYLLSNISFGGLTLGAGQYWLAISDYVNNEFPDQYGYWSTSAQVGNQAYSYNNGASWGHNDVEGAFSIYGTQNTVPEPGSLALLGSGLIALFPTVRSRLKKK